MLSTFTHIDTFDHLAKSALTKILNDFIFFVFRRYDNLILFENVFSTTSETNLLILISLLSHAILSIPLKSFLKEIIILENMIVMFV